MNERGKLKALLGHARSDGSDFYSIYACTRFFFHRNIHPVQTMRGFPHFVFMSTINLSTIIIINSVASIHAFCRLSSRVVRTGQEDDGYDL